MLLNVDVKSLEWYSYVYLSQDKVAIKEWQENLDMHQNNQDAFNLPSRLIAKKFLFRWIYYGSAYAYAHDPQFSTVSTKVSYWEDVIEKYYSKYKGVHNLHKKLIDTAVRTGKIVSPTGRTYYYKPYLKNGERVWPKTQITNHVNQGLGADLMSLTRVILRRKLKEKELKSVTVTSIHDSIVCDCPKIELPIVRQAMIETFNEVPRNFNELFKPNIPLTLEYRGEFSCGSTKAEHL